MHAPAHGYRAKHSKERGPERPDRPETPKGGVEVVFDSERGIYVGVKLPDIIFHSGHYYREHAGRWQVSMNGHGDWSFAAETSVPQIVVRAGSKSDRDEYARKKKSQRHSGPAKLWRYWD